MKQFLLLFFVLATTLVFSQNDADYVALQKDIKKENIKGLVNFQKACKFFFEKQRDSSFLYSSQAYNTAIKNPKVKNYLNLIYGINAYHKKAFSLAEKQLKELPSNFTYNYLVNYTLGNLNLENKKYETALSYYKLLLDTNYIQSPERRSDLYHNVGACYIFLEEYANAESYFIKESSLIKPTDTLSIIYNKTDLANAYYLQYKDSMAIPAFKEAYRLASLLSNIQAKASTSKNLASVEFELKKYKQSALFYKKHLKWKDSLNNINNMSKLLEKDKQLALALKKKEIDAEKEINKKQQQLINLCVTIIVIVVLFLCILYYLYHAKQKQNRIINAQNTALAQLNNTKNYLFSVISHDLRSPINVLAKQQDKLLKHIEAQDLVKIKNHSSKTVKLAKSLQHLTNNVLNWSLEQNEKVIFDKKIWGLSPIINQVLADFKTLAAVKQITINTTFNDTINVNVDRESLKIILRNLIDNAIKYTPENKTICITTTNSKNDTFFEIKNDGEGISKEQLSKIKELNELEIDQINRSKGVGLGLLLCTTLTKKNDAVLKVESEQGKNTTVRIYFTNNS